MKIVTKELLKATKIIDTIISPRAINPKTQAFYVTYDSDKNLGYAYGNNGTVAAFVRLKTISSDIPFNMAVSCEKLRGCLSQLKCDTIEIERKNNESKSIIFDNSDRYTLFNCDNDFSYIQPFPDVTKSVITMELNNFKTALNKTLFAVSEGSDRNNLRGIHIKSDKDTISFLGLNPCSMAQYTTKNENDCDSPDEFLLAPGPLKTFMSMTEEGKIKISHAVKGNSVCVSYNDDIIFIMPMVAGKNIKMDEYIPNDYHWHIRFKKEDLLDIINKAATFVSVFDPSINLTFNNDQLTVTSANWQYGETDLRLEFGDDKNNKIIKNESPKKSITIAINPKIISPAIKQADDIIDLFMVNDQHPCHLKENDYQYIFFGLAKSDNEKKD
jgi:DNA polymerase III sliding clamp (beta) subunit (PCNA family)